MYHPSSPPQNQHTHVPSLVVPSGNRYSQYFEINRSVKIKIEKKKEKIRRMKPAVLYLSRLFNTNNNGLFWSSLTIRTFDIAGLNVERFVNRYIVPFGFFVVQVATPGNAWKVVLRRILRKIRCVDLMIQAYVGA